MPRITPTHSRKLEKVLLAKGFRFARQKGDHRTYVKEGAARPVVVPTYDEVPVPIITNNLRTAGISREEYFELLTE
jgi:predicted RNA binding protein YcfA (HicA-like mRNA interferase family)